MKLKPYLMLALLYAVAQGVWAQNVLFDNEFQLIQALADGQTNIRLDADIQLSNYLDIDHKSVTIDLNGHKLYLKHDSQGHVIWVHNGSNLTLTSSVYGGSIEGGMATNGGGINVWPGCTLTVTGAIFKNNSASDNGGAIFARNGANVTISNASFIGNSASDHGGAIWNNGMLSATDCSFENNTASDVGGIYNSVTETDGTTYTGTATLMGCTFTGNKGTAGAGALANALGATEMTIEDCTITDNIASSHGGGIWNGGTLTVTNSTFTNNIANDVGGIYNAVSTDDTIAGKATLTGCTFTGNAGTAGAGALANALGATVMTIENCTITGNTADSNGGGIWNGGTLNMKGEVTVTDNKKNNDGDSNVYLKNGKVITVAEALTGSSIGVALESATGTFTSGYKTYHVDVVPSTFFSSDLSAVVFMELTDKKEACLTAYSTINFIERSWDATNKKVVNTEKSLTTLIANDVEPTIDGQYKEVTNAPASTPNEWFGMGGYNNNVAEYYVVRGNVKRETIVVQGSDVHLVLCDGATLTLTGGLKLEGDNKLYIHCQSYDGNMGRLIVTNKYEKAAGIGSAQDNGTDKTVGELVIYGGHIEATGGKYGAGIGSCANSSILNISSQLCNKVSVYGGYVKATSGDLSAGIGGGANIDGGDFILYDGTVIAEGKTSGVGGGGSSASLGGNVTVYGGSLTASGKNGAGIGSSFNSLDDAFGLRGGTFTIFDGTVTANGGRGGAGIGGGHNCGGAKEVNIYGGTVIANGSSGGAGIGGGDYSYAGTVTISGGTVTATGGYGAAGIGGGIRGHGGYATITGGTVIATGGESGAGIGGGREGQGADVTITGGSVIAKAGKQGSASHRAIGPGTNNFTFHKLSIGDAMMVGAGNYGSVESIFTADERVNACWHHTYAEISPCTHPGATYTIEGTNANGTHTAHCSHCTKAIAAEPHDFDENGECTLCHYKGDTYTVTIYLPDANDDDTYEEDGRYKTYQYNMVAGTTFTLPGAPQDLQDMEFAGWLVKPTTDVTPSFSTYKTSDDETLLPEKSPYTLNDNVNFIARYKDITISLADDSDNAETLYTYDGKKATSVTLTGRTLYKDGKWNTLCLPFSLTEAQVTAQLAPGELKTLASSDFAGGTLTLNFADATTIEAGKPYIIKWTSGSDIDEPTFSGVTISNATTPVETKYVDFVGTFSPIDIFTEYKTNLYLAANNKLCYPSGEEMTSFIINSCRAFFQLKEGLTAGEPVTTEGQPIKAFVLNFGEEETGIEEVNGYGLWVNGYGAGWCTLDGCRLLDKPSSPGIYIHNGVKVLIK